MKKGTVLNSEISSVISRLGHTDTLVVCDAGLPIPNSTARIDMALTQGVPSFMQVVDVVTREMQVEAAILATEIKQQNPQLHETLLTHLEQLQQHQGNTIKISYTTHEQFKKLTADSQAVIRIRGVFPVCERHSLRWRYVLRPLWTHYCNSKGSIKRSPA